MCKRAVTAHLNSKNTFGSPGALSATEKHYAFLKKRPPTLAGRGCPLPRPRVLHEHPATDGLHNSGGLFAAGRGIPRGIRRPAEGGISTPGAEAPGNPPTPVSDQGERYNSVRAFLGPDVFDCLCPEGPAIAGPWGSY